MTSCIASTDSGVVHVLYRSMMGLSTVPRERKGLGGRQDGPSKREHAPVDLPERVPPRELAQEHLGLRVKARDVQRGGDGLGARELVRCRALDQSAPRLGVARVDE